MSKTIVIDRQSLLDIALQEYGNTQAAFSLAVANSIDITDELTPGQELILPENGYTENDILDFYKTKDIKPVTATPSVSSPQTLGIGTMIIGQTFIVQ